MKSSATAYRSNIATEAPAFVVKTILPEVLRSAGQIGLWSHHIKVLHDSEADLAEIEASRAWSRAKSKEVATYLVTNDLFIFSKRDSLHRDVSSLAHRRSSLSGLMWGY